MAETAPAGAFFDPFAPEGEQFFDPVESYDVMEQQYVAGSVEHDYSADQFVADVAALVLDARYNDMFEQAAMIEARMHQLCGGMDGHGGLALSDSMKSNAVFGAHDEHDRHDHDHGHGGRGSSGRHDHDVKVGAANKKKKHRERQARPVWPGLAAKLIELTRDVKKG